MGLRFGSGTISLEEPVPECNFGLNFSSGLFQITEGIKYSRIFSYTCYTASFWANEDINICNYFKFFYLFVLPSNSEHLAQSEIQIKLRQTVDDLSLMPNCSDTVSEGNKGLF